AVIPAAFDYERAGSVDEAVQLLGKHGEDAKLIAGGHSLLPLMKLRLARPTVLVDIDRLSDLEYVREDGDRIEIGALTRICDVAADPMVKEHWGRLVYAAGAVGGPRVRHGGRMRGSGALGDRARDAPC